MTDWTNFSGDAENGVFITVSALQQIINNTTNIYERVNVLESLKGGGVPIGAVMLWKGTYASIPDGFQLADGTNGTPDLRGKFVIGIAATEDDDDLNGAGGASTHLHAMGAISTASAHTHTLYLNDNIYANTYEVGASASVSATSHNHGWSATTNSKGAHTHTSAYTATSHLPPYTKYYWIARIPA
jgi:hypothetical protein